MSPIDTLIRDYIEVWNQHDVDALLRCFVDDCYYEDTAFGVHYRGKTQLRELCKNSFRTFPNLRFEVVEVYGSTEGVGWNWTMSGNYLARIEALRVPATGQAILVKGASVTKLRGGLVEHNVDYYDSLKFFQQLGAFPPEG